MTDVNPNDNDTTEAGAELISIGAFARRSGLTASALRFYDDSGMLRPASVDAASGYRYYHLDQLERAVAVRRLRELDMPLPSVAGVLDADATQAVRLIDEHVSALSARADDARRAATEIKTTLTGTAAMPLAVVKGPVFAAAVDQVLAATGESEEYPVISGVRLEVSGEALTLTATDRHRLSVRTLVPDETAGSDWAATLEGADLRSALGELRRTHLVHLEALPDSLRFASAGRHQGDLGGAQRDTRRFRAYVDSPRAMHCRLVGGAFPDRHMLMAQLSEPRARIVVAKGALLAAIETAEDETVRLRTSAGQVALASPGGVVQSSAEAVVDGSDTETWFAVTVLHPAIATAIGPDLMLDIRGPNEPVTVRSADNGDLATLAMPVEPPVEAAT